MLTIDQKILDAFHSMWGSFPEPVTLVHKSREVLAVNKACAGIRTVGTKCSTQGGPEAHRGCKANKALASGQATYSKQDVNGKPVIAYWLPVENEPDIFVHFGVGITIDYDATEAQA